MTKIQYNNFCKSLIASTFVEQWGAAQVWKVGGKVFAIAGWNKGEQLAVTFKTTALDFDILKDHPGCRPAPYLASRGFKWIQRFDDCEMLDDELKLYIQDSHQLIANALSKKKQRELGLMKTNK
ncbi:MAG: MmcQ/YjbR family DNA-binding protein [Saccharospirillaceae bacterium]|nr:MmcQ/YjbR family DNA-binding protein [Pseudomonadales bacterium]NRB77528.1 MmcQ/YjbR family DNA-binding protein [Saccharospirillaceae bacterium]